MMLQVASAISLVCSIACLGNTISKGASKFDKIFFCAASIIFILLSLIIQLGVIGKC